MILRRYGSSVHSVVIDFDSKALTEIKFRKDQAHSQPLDEFNAAHESVREHSLEATAEGWVQDEVERVLLADLEKQVRALQAGLSAGEVLLIESEPGTDYPKTHTKQRTVVVESENRLHFTSTIRPPLRLAVYRAKDRA